MAKATLIHIQILTLGVSVNLWVFANIIGIGNVEGDAIKGTMNSLKVR
jgi:hypothetical protein